METTITEKGQIVIPADLRRKYGMTRGMRIQVIDEGDEIVLKPITPGYVRSLRGKLKGRAGMAALKADRQRERDL